MHIEENKSLKPYNTFGIEAVASHFAKVQSVDELAALLSMPEYPHPFILGGGSNMLLTKDIDTLVIHIALKGIEIVEETENDVYVRAHAGENWHNFVLWCIAKDFGGVENLSLIPGNVGGAPIQNIGAYGVELKDVFVSCEAFDISEKKIKTFHLKACNFGYRESIFKNQEKGKYIITSVTVRLTKGNHQLRTQYGDIQAQLEANGIANPTIRDVSNAVIAIRQSKLPDPKEIGNSGSFFKNPVISIAQLDDLKRNFPVIPNYKVSDTEVKIPAGWLIEKAGFKGKTFSNYGVHKKQALVLVNYGGAKGKDIFELSQLIRKTIYRIFNINLATEVNIV